jgi:DMSO/TMAO reductase YedYZ molybdopterin-dependent catalytic subunit
LQRCLEDERTVSIIDHRTKATKEFKSQDIAELSQISIRSALMAGDCEGFNGIYSYEGPLLRSILEWFGQSWQVRDYSRFVAVSSEDGFCSTFSMGELFNSRLDNNIVIAHKKDGASLEPKAGFATSVVGEDSLGGRSVKRISKIEIF